MNTVNIPPEVLGKVGEAFAVSLDALQRRLQPLLPAAQADADAVRASVDRLEQLAIQLQELFDGATRRIVDLIEFCN